MNTQLPHIFINGEELTPVLMPYANRTPSGQRVCAVQVLADDGPFMRLSINLEDIPPQPWTFWVKTWSENAPYTHEILNQCDWLKKVGEHMVNNFGCIAELWEIQPEVLPKPMAEEIASTMEWIPSDNERSKFSERVRA